MLCLVVIKTIVVDAWRGIGWALKTRVAKFVLSAAFFIGSGAGLRQNTLAASAGYREERRVFDVLKAVQKGDDESEIRRRDDEVTLRREGIVVVGRRIRR